MLSALKDFPVRSSVVFSSIAGRFGNGGQTDYSAANDFLCKSSSNFKSTRPDTIGIAIDWTAWGEIGMAARGSIPTVMKQAGIDMLPPKAGIPFIRSEITRGNKGEEVVAALSLGMMLEEFDESGGLETSSESPLINDTKGIMVSSVKGMGLYGGLTTKVVLDPKVQPFLFPHFNNTGSLKTQFY